LDQLVLGSGGVLGDTWMSGVIAGILDSGGPDLRESGRFLGTSAGSIVATRLAAGQDMREYLARRFDRGPSRAERELEAGEAEAEGRGERGPSFFDRAGSAALRTSGPGGRFLRRSILRLIPTGTRELGQLGRSIERMMPDWDPRLSMVGLSLETGARVVINQENDFGLTPSQAVRASCAIPAVFAPVPSEAGPLVDGGAWSPVNLDAAPVGPGDAVLCLYPSGYRSSGSVLRGLAGSLSRSRVRVEQAAVRSAGARVMTVKPDPEAAAAIGPNRMDGTRDPAVAAAGFRQGREISERIAGWLDSSASRPQQAVPDPE
jgi:NTE family protein